MPVGTPGRSNYIQVYDKFEHLPQFVLVHSQLHTSMWYIGLPGSNSTARRIYHPLRHGVSSTKKSGHPPGHARPSNNGHNFFQTRQNPQVIRNDVFYTKYHRQWR